MSADRDIFEILPTELIYYILDFLNPDDYTGLSCTCTRALALVNTNLQRNSDYVGERANVFLSLTGYSIELRREKQWMDIVLSSCCLTEFDGAPMPLPDEDDPYL